MPSLGENIDSCLENCHRKRQDGLEKTDGFAHDRLVNRFVDRFVFNCECSTNVTEHRTKKEMD